jgi:hypothetical protein
MNLEVAANTTETVERGPAACKAFDAHSCSLAMNWNALIENQGFLIDAARARSRKEIEFALRPE